MFRIIDIPDKKSPHIKAVIYHGLEGEDSTLCRGELLIILRLMLSQLRKVRLLHHKVAPVSLWFPRLPIDFCTLLTGYSADFDCLVYRQECAFVGVLLWWWEPCSALFWSLRVIWADNHVDGFQGLRGVVPRWASGKRSRLRILFLWVGKVLNGLWIGLRLWLVRFECFYSIRAGFSLLMYVTYYVFNVINATS